MISSPDEPRPGHFPTAMAADAADLQDELRAVRARIAELECTADHFNNLLAGSDIPALFLDHQLAIKWFSPAFSRLFDFADSAIGQSIEHFAHKFDDDGLVRDARTVLECISAMDAEIPGAGGQWYLRRILPYRTGGGGIDGVAITFTDITQKRASEAGQRHSEQHLRELMAALPGAVYTTDARGRITFCNPAAIKFWGRTPDAEKDLWGGAVRLYHRDGAPLSLDQSPMAIAVRENRAIHGAEIIAERADGKRVPYLSYPTPLHDADGNVTGAVNMLIDISERKQAEAVARQLVAIVKSSDDAILSKSPDGIITSWNDGAQRLLGYEAAEIVGKSIMAIVPDDRRQEEADFLRRVRTGQHIPHLRTQRQRKDGSLIWLSLTISPVHNAAGEITGISSIARDLTHTLASEENRRSLMRELNHRVKNTMAVVQAIAAQTLDHATSLRDARDKFSARLLNLAQAHDLLTRESWQGANLSETIADSIRPYRNNSGRFRVRSAPDTPEIRLAPGAILSISMAVHELCTNAAKYGALSQPNGYVTINWRLVADQGRRQLVLEWQEHDGPRVEPPSHRGFGSRMIERAVTAELGGEVRMEYALAGLHCTIVMPLGMESATTRDAAGSADDSGAFSIRP